MPVTSAESICGKTDSHSSTRVPSLCKSIYRRCAKWSHKPSRTPTRALHPRGCWCGVPCWGHLIKLNDKHFTAWSGEKLLGRRRVCFPTFQLLVSFQSTLLFCRAIWNIIDFTDCLTVHSVRLLLECNRCIYSGRYFIYSDTLYYSAPLQFRGKYCTSYPTRFISTSSGGM